MENQPNYIRSISLENVRCFGSKQTLYFTQNNQTDGKIAMWNVILGNNGTGKTTVLKNIVASHSDDILLSIFLNKETPEYLSKKNLTKEQLVTLMYRDNRSRNITDRNSEYTKKSDEINRPRFKTGIYAYGASRKISSEGLVLEASNYQTTTLFDENAYLTNAEVWLIQAEYLSLKEDGKYKERYELVKRTLKELLRDEVSDFYIVTENNIPKVYFKTHYGDVRLHDLSLGYKTLIAWVTDLARGLIDTYNNVYIHSENPLAEPTVCLVDEIDLHMHPQMQRNVMKFLRETFPKTQFICTAHSPLIVQSGEDANIILLRRQGDEVEVVNDVDDAKNWRIDQILDSDLFENTSSYAPSIQQKVSKRRAILLKDKPSKREKAELSKLDDSLDNLSVTESPEYLQALKILSKVQKNG